MTHRHLTTGQIIPSSFSVTSDMLSWKVWFRGEYDLNMMSEIWEMVPRSRSSIVVIYFILLINSVFIII